MSWLENWDLEATGGLPQWKVQGSPEWLETRKNYLGASECAAVLGLNPYKTAEQLWQEKVGLREPDKENYHMRRGKEKEDMIIGRWLEINQESWSTKGGPDVEISKDYPFLRASYDYISREGDYILEVKAPEKIYKEVPKMYWVQIQFQLLISGLKYGHFYALDEEGKHLSYTHFLDNLFIADAIPRLQKFWHHVQTKTPLIETAEAQIENAEFEALLLELEEKDQELKHLDKRVTEIRSLIRSHLTADTTKIGDFMVYIKKRKGAVDYGKVPELSQVDLDKYRKAEQSYMTISRREK